MEGDHHDMGMSWWRFAGMIAASTVIMFVLMYQLVFSLDHMFFSVNRLMASLIMACAMIIVMLGFMWNMYRGTGPKLLVLLSAGVIGAGLLYLNRAQDLIGDLAFMRAMIPHHSIAVNNATKATIRDPRVRKLADGIIQSQMKEITEMKLLIQDIEAKGTSGTVALPPVSATVTPNMQTRAEEDAR